MACSICGFVTAEGSM